MNPSITEETGRGMLQVMPQDSGEQDSPWQANWRGGKKVKPQTLRSFHFNRGRGRRKGGQ